MMADKPRTDWFKSLNCDGARGMALLWSVLLLSVLALGGERWRLWLEYQRQALSMDQWWRLLSAHLVHLNFVHLVFNLVGLMVLWIMFATEWWLTRWLMIVVGAILAIDIGLWFGSPEVQWYVGASGVLHGIWAAGAWAQLRRRLALGALPLLLLVVKLAYEQLHQTSLVLGNLPVVTEAHLYGTVGGLLSAWALARFSKPL